MATESQVKSFISQIGPIIQKVAKEKGYKYPSAVIAQACVESAYGTSGLSSKYFNYFGMKCGSSWTGKSVNMTTKEEYTKGTTTTIKDNFRVYDNMEAGVRGYFDFINKTRYANLKNATSSKNYLEKLKEDGYATASSYVTIIYNVVTKYDLLKYDSDSSTTATKATTTTTKTVSTVSYYPKYTGKSTSLTAAMNSLGIDSSKANRAKIAAKNGIKNYNYTSAQNTQMLNLLKAGKLIKA